MFAESDLIPISALQHYLVCPRQCALIHIEQQWQENQYTAEGRILHESVDQKTSCLRGAVRRATALGLHSLRLGLTGIADVVEFHTDSLNATSPRPFPVEHKRGRPKKGLEDRIQLCAQGMCLEEMLETHIPEGALFYGKNRRRHQVIFDESLRSHTENTAVAVHELFAANITPPPPQQAPCAACSLHNICQPDLLRGRKKSVRDYYSRMLEVM